MLFVAGQTGRLPVEGTPIICWSSSKHSDVAGLHETVDRVQVPAALLESELWPLCMQLTSSRHAQCTLQPVSVALSLSSQAVAYFCITCAHCQQFTLQSYQLTRDAVVVVPKCDLLSDWL